MRWPEPPHARSRPSSRGSATTRRDFLAELVKVPSDNPPGDCAPHGERAAELLEGLGFDVERHPVPADVVRANGMISATNLVVRERFGDGPTIALNAHGDVVPPGLGLDDGSLRRRDQDGFMYGRGVAVSKSDFATYAFALLALKASGAKLRRHRRAALHLRRGSRRRHRPGVAARAGHLAARLRDLRRLLLRHHHGAQRLPAPRSRDRRQVRARGAPGHRHRCAGSGDRRAGRPLRDPQDVRGEEIEGRRHRQPHAHRRPDLRRHQHQRRAGQGHVPRRPAHHSRGETRRRPKPR